jgi:hypothetical protein
MQLQITIVREFGTNLSSAEMFQYPTISSLAKRLGQPSAESLEFETIHNRAQMQRAALNRRPPINKA